VSDDGWLGTTFLQPVPMRRPAAFEWRYNQERVGIRVKLNIDSFIGQ
jgi:hypothetical protein